MNIYQYVWGFIEESWLMLQLKKTSLSDPAQAVVQQLAF
jgi:hypothetical protein